MLVSRVYVDVARFWEPLIHDVSLLV